MDDDNCASMPGVAPAEAGHRVPEKKDQMLNAACISLFQAIVLYQQCSLAALGRKSGS